jgi:flagellar basal body-associated protein FliL
MRMWVIVAVAAVAAGLVFWHLRRDRQRRNAAEKAAPVYVCNQCNELDCSCEKQDDHQ